jgi:hypothetical protein
VQVSCPCSSKIISMLSSSNLLPPSMWTHRW